MINHRENTPHADPFNIFEQFGFGGFGGFGGGGRRQEMRTPNVVIPLSVTLKQLYLGDLLDVEYIRQVLCVEANSCQKNNQECQGPGIKVRMQQLAPGFVQQVQVSLSMLARLGRQSSFKITVEQSRQMIGTRSKLCSTRQVMENKLQSVSQRHD